MSFHMSNGRRIYTLGNDRVIEDLKGIIGSISKFNPDIPLYVIAYDNNVDETRRICRMNGAHLIEFNLETYDDLGRGFSKQFEKGMKIFRKFKSFHDHEDVFLFLDADCLVFRDISFIFDKFHASKGDICFYASSGQGRNFDKDDIKSVAERVLGARDGLNAAFFMSRGGMMPLEFLRALAHRMLSLQQMFGLRHEQAFLNYCALILGLDVKKLRDIAPKDICAWDVRARIIETSEGYFFENSRQPPISVLHYSSAHWRTGVNRDIYQYFAGLAETPNLAP